MFNFFFNNNNFLTFSQSFDFILNSKISMAKTTSSEIINQKSRNKENINNKQKISIKKILSNDINKKVQNSFGSVLSITDQVIIAKGLRNVFLGELVFFKKRYSTLTGQVLNLESDGTVKIVLLEGLQSKLSVGNSVFRTYHSPQVPTGFSILGQVINPAGKLLNLEDFNDAELFRSTLLNNSMSSLEAEAPGVIDREPVRTPVATGINTVDSLIPVGCGQRELIIGDKNSGKTTLGLTSILNQAYMNNERNKKWREVDKNLITDKHSSLKPCIYVSIGQRRSEIFRIKTLLKQLNSLCYTSIVFTSADDNPALQYLAPYAGTTIGEWFRDRGYFSLVVYDDLTNHAVAYRQMSLLLRRPPGREAYPGDIFYLHAKLLERSAQLNKRKGGGGLTSLPIVETKGNDISAYIPTNVISITDGQIYLSSDVALKGIRPAIDISLSVSRVGGSAQTPSMNDISKKAKKDYVLYINFQGVEKLGGTSDPVALSYIKRGKRINGYLSQTLYDTSKLYNQVICFLNLCEGLVDKVHEFLIAVYFKLLFNNFLANGFLDFSLYYLLYFSYEIESVFISQNLKLLSSDLLNWSNSYNEFFLKNVQPRINNSNTAIFKRALKGNFYI